MFFLPVPVLVFNVNVECPPQYNKDRNNVNYTMVERNQFKKRAERILRLPERGNDDTYLKAAFCLIPVWAMSIV